MSNYIKILPNYLINRYKIWRSTIFEDNKSLYLKLAKEGQSPTTMVISCCDARLHVTSIFGSDVGEFFIHRNIANLVPPFNPEGDHHGTSAAVEYAVTVLNVSSIIVLGHSKCGGISRGYDLCKRAENLETSFFVDKWLKIIKPAYQIVIDKDINLPKVDQIKDLEKESVKTSIKNLIEFPFVNEALKKNHLVLHGLWHEIGTANLEALDPNNFQFQKI